MRSSAIIGYLLGALLVGSAIFPSSCKHSPIIDDDEMPIDTTDNPVDTTDMDTTGTPCDPDVVYFEQEVLPILISNCAMSGCHDANTATEGVVLNNYDNVVNTADVDPFDLDGSDLYEVITDDDPDKRMPPPPNSALTAEEINLIAKWILQGAEDLDCDPNAGGCDTDDISFSATVQPAMATYCEGCHSGAVPSAGIDLTTYANVSAVANSGQLYGVIAHQPGYPPMPQGGNQLNDCLIDQIQSWIDAGAPNN